VTRSESTKEIAAALAKAQGVIKGAAKDRLNPHFKRAYADLASVWDACRAPLAANGIAVIQGVEADGGTVRVETMLAHASGEWMASTLTLLATPATPQGVGSALTYGRRYGLAAMVGIAPEDDDGNAASVGGADAADDRAAPPPRQSATVGDVALKFGRGKDKMLSAVTDDDVRWYIGVWEKDLGDPEKTKFHAKVRENIATAHAILASRAKPDGSPASKWDRVKALAPQLADETLRVIVKDATGKASAGALDEADFLAIATAIAAHVAGADIQY
jgi:hypothetical protein